MRERSREKEGDREVKKDSTVMGNHWLSTGKLSDLRNEGLQGEE